MSYIIAVRSRKQSGSLSFRDTYPNEACHSPILGRSRVAANPRSDVISTLIIRVFGFFELLARNRRRGSPRPSELLRLLSPNHPVRH